jgi:DUF2971 family protein
MDSDDTSQLPQSLYYYVNVSDTLRRGWVEEILLENKIYFRQREELNDVNELRPSLIFEGTKEQKREHVRLLISRQPGRLPPAKRLLQEQRLMRRLEGSTEWVDAILHDLLGNIGVFCLSDSISDELMWAHYANGSRGVAIEFDPYSGLFAMAQKVHYSNDPPVINRLRDDWNVILQKSMFTKRLSWSYEREWRVIARFQDAIRQENGAHKMDLPSDVLSFWNAQNGPGHYSFPPQAVTSIVLGVRSPSDDVAWLNGVLQRRAGPVPVHRTRLLGGKVVAGKC